jgi:hypothetical protein
MISRLARDPLVHFLALGLSLFVLYALVAPRDTGEDRIVIGAGIVQDLRLQHEKLWGRPPTPEELQGLIDNRVTDEILYREGLKLGLDRDDPVVKRRVRQKYELIAEEADSVEPTDADLAAFLAQHPDRFQRPAAVSFMQVLVPVDGPGDEVEARVTAVKDALEGGAPPETAGRPTLLPLVTERQPLDLVARGFGEEFAQALATLPVGQWQGPVTSGYGIHVVRIAERSEPALPPLADIRAEVQREWEAEHRREARATRLAQLRQQYEVIVEGVE